MLVQRAKIGLLPVERYVKSSSIHERDGFNLETCYRNFRNERGSLTAQCFGVSSSK